MVVINHIKCISVEYDVMTPFPQLQILNIDTIKTQRLCSIYVYVMNQIWAVWSNKFKKIYENDAKLRRYIRLKDETLIMCVY